MAASDLGAFLVRGWSYGTGVFNMNVPFWRILRVQIADYGDSDSGAGAMSRFHARDGGHRGHASDGSPAAVQCPSMVDDASGYYLQLRVLRYY